MKIKLLQDCFDNDLKVFQENEEVEIKNETQNLLYIKTIKGQKYCLDKEDEGKYFVIVK